MSILVREYLNKKSKAGMLGIEIEVEAGAQLPIQAQTPKPWLAKPDNSLRQAVPGGAMEYVTSGAIDLESKLKSIKALTDVLNKAELKVDKDSPRTSIHVHVNVLEFTPRQVWTAVTGYWLLENIFMAYCGEDRQGNMYCLRLKDAEGVLERIKADVAGRYPFEKLDSDRIRYCGQNLKAIPQFGSIEYRGMRGTTEPYTIDRWSTMMYDVVTRSKRFKGPDSVLDYYWKFGPVHLMNSLVAPQNQEILQNGCKKWKDEIEETSGALFELAYETDWDAWEKAMDASYRKRQEEKKAKKAGHEAYAQQVFNAFRPRAVRARGIEEPMVAGWMGHDVLIGED